MTTTWDPSYKTGSVTLSGGNLVATASAAGHGAGSNTVVTGKGYIEFLCEAGRQAVGLIVKDLAGHPADTSASISIYTDGTTGYFGLYDADAGIGSVSFAPGDRVCLAYDVAAELAWFRVNNGNWNNSGSANPAAGVGGLDVGRDMTAANTVLWLYSDQSGAKATINAGASAFTYTPPSGFAGPDAPVTAGLILPSPIRPFMHNLAR